VVAVAGCSAEHATFLGDATSTQSTTSKAAKPSRVAAERAAAAAKAAAEAEAAASPLVLFFGSQVQPDAVAAQARLDQLIAEGATVAKSAPKTAARAAKSAVASKTANTTVAKIEGHRSPGIPATAPASNIGAPKGATSIANAVSVTPRAAQNPEPLLAGTPTDLVVYDVVSGIKTMHRANGTVEEEAFDPATLPAIKAARSSGKTRIRIVNETNPASTGSTAGAQPQPPVAIKAGPR
jgi:hypothetical protein